jgi:hypothetical protein
MSVRYTAKVEAVIPQLVHCTYCDCKFIYEMTVTGYGFGDSGYKWTDAGTRKAEKQARKASEKNARKHLKRQLNRRGLCDAVPCAECYRYQPYMEQLLQGKQYTGMGCLAAIIFLMAVTFVFGGVKFLTESRAYSKMLGCFAMALVVGLVGFAVLRLMYWMQSRYDPNEEEELASRSARADERTMSLEEYNKEQLRRVRSAYDNYTTATQDKPRRKGQRKENSESLILDWWVLPSAFLEETTLSIEVVEGEFATVVVPEDMEPGSVLEPEIDDTILVPFEVRIMAMYVHPDEAQEE